MPNLSKFYNVTLQIMVEYILKDTETTPPELTGYVMYTGLDNNVYFSTIDDSPQTSHPANFLKFSDKSDSVYTYLGIQKHTAGPEINYNNKDILDDKVFKNTGVSDYINSYTKNNEPQSKISVVFDTIRIHLIYGFLLDRLAGLSILLKTKAGYYGPMLKREPNSVSKLIFNHRGEPEFDTYSILDTDGSTLLLERLVWDERVLTLLDYYMPKEILSGDSKMVKYHKSPIYLNGVFYDRYIDIKVPSAKYLSEHSDINLSTENPWGYKGEFKEVINGRVTDDGGNTAERYADPLEAGHRKIHFNIMPDPMVVINFATVSSDSFVPNVEDSSILYAGDFHLDPINQIAINSLSNADNFNIRLKLVPDKGRIEYYPLYGNQPMNKATFMRIEQGEVPFISEAFYDIRERESMNEFEYGFKWIIYNELNVTYTYSDNILNLSTAFSGGLTASKQFTDIIDYSLHDDIEGPFWKGSFTPDPPEKVGTHIQSIAVSYTCRLVNRLTGIEAMRNATLNITGSEVLRYIKGRVLLNNIKTYHITNAIKQEKLVYKESEPLLTEKLIRCYYDATNLVVKDMTNNNIYTLGQMTLLLKRTASNYMLRFFNINHDNIRVPFDLTGPYKYRLEFPMPDGSKLTLRPNDDSIDLNYGIGQLVFYITEEQSKRIMSVDGIDRYFAVVVHTDKDDLYMSTLYEGKVAYY